MAASGGANDRIAAVTALRIRLRQNGYVPVPVTAPDYQHKLVRNPGKQPFFRGWSELSLDSVTPEIIRGWPDSIRHHPNTGLLCGTLVVVDADVLEPELAASIAALAKAVCGKTPLRRVGRAPKFALLYRVASPLAKMETPDLILPSGLKAQVEVLGLGQQVVAFGIHPDTLQAYQWPEGSPDSHAFADLPEVTEAVLRRFLAATEALIRAAGGRAAEKSAQDEKPAQDGEPHTEPPQDGPGTKGAEPGGHRTGKARGGFFWEVNRLALGDIEPWFKALFPLARWQTNNATPPGMWRVSFADLGRPLEEDLSMHPTEGGMDWGTRQSCSPIDVVIRWGGAPDAAAAALWLCDKLGQDPVMLGWNGPAAGARQDRGAAPRSG
jgi:hypothetical protein